MFRQWRCWFRLYHQWSEPTTTTTAQGTRIIHECLRCGKRTVRLIKNQE